MGHLERRICMGNETGVAIRPISETRSIELHPRDTEGTEVVITTTTKFLWEAHKHQFVKRHWRGSSCYSDGRDANVCTLCDAARKEMDPPGEAFPEKQHHRHPRGCRCYWCVFCRCREVEERDKGLSLRPT